MHASVGRLNPQTQVSIFAVPLALLALGTSWMNVSVHSALAENPATMLLALCLLAALALSNQFPIHIRVSSKIYMGSVVLYLMAALLPPPLAATAAGLGTLVGEFSVQARTGNPTAFIVSQAARWVVLVLGASLIGHIPVEGQLAPLPAIAAGVMLWAGDILSFPLVYCPVTGERPVRVITAIAKEGGLTEAAQYVVGVIGAFETARGLWTLGLLLLPVALVYVAFKNTKEMHDETRRILENMADTVDLRDPYTGGHSRRVTELVRGILDEMGKHGPEVKLIISAARVHDIGKIGIPDAILKKDGTLTDEECATMKKHPEQGAELLRRYPDFARGVSIIRHHHERWDGTGYPHRLSGKDIPFGSRVIAVADTYDAITSDRPYRQGMSPTQAAVILREGRGIQWDPDMVDAFLRSITDRLEESAVPVLRLVPRPSDSHESIVTA